MKKIISLGLTAALILSVGVATAFAATPMRGANYADTDGNGVCDNNDIRDKIGTYSNFVDEDGNGECDNIGTGADSNQGQGKIGRQGRGRNR